MPSQSVAAIVPAAGSGERLGAGVPKAMALLAGEPILVHAVRALVAEPRVGLVVLACPEGLETAMAEVAATAARGVPVVAVTGGSLRAESVALALAVVPEEFGIVLVHDAARCLVPLAVVAAVIDAVVAGAPAVVPGLPVVDTIRALHADGSSSTLDRDTLRAVQTPQGFPAEVLRHAHGGGDRAATDDAGMVEALGLAVTLVPGDARAFKVTTPQDLLLAEAMLAGTTLAGTMPAETTLAGARAAAPRGEEEGP